MEEEQITELSTMTKEEIEGLWPFGFNYKSFFSCSLWLGGVDQGAASEGESR